jgi:hypothetical protein
VTLRIELLVHALATAHGRLSAPAWPGQRALARTRSRAARGQSSPPPAPAACAAGTRISLRQPVQRDSRARSLRVHRGARPQAGREEQITQPMTRHHTNHADHPRATYAPIGAGSPAGASCELPDRARRQSLHLPGPPARACDRTATTRQVSCGGHPHAVGSVQAAGARREQHGHGDAPSGVGGARQRLAAAHARPGAAGRPHPATPSPSDRSTVSVAIYCTAARRSIPGDVKPSARAASSAWCRLTRFARAFADRLPGCAPTRCRCGGASKRPIGPWTTVGP